MKTIERDAAQRLIDFAPSEGARSMGFAQAQLEGAVAAHNMLARNGIAYVADEVGLGKTYVALGAMGLMRHFQPRARMMVIAPRENLQRKWVKELRNFTRAHWQVEDNRVRSLHGDPVHPPVTCARFDELARAVQVSDHCDLFLRSTTFSVSVRNGDARKRCRRRLLPYLPWLEKRFLDARQGPEHFRDAYGRALNALMPEIDLLIVDEAHNLKHGFGANVSNRNRLLGLTLGHPAGNDGTCPWYGPRAKRVLLLSATPFERGYEDLHGTLDTVGFGDERLRDADGKDPRSVRTLVDDDDEDAKYELLQRCLLRRVSHFRIGGKDYGRNMYRREWRHGGYEAPDEPMRLEDPRQRLIVGLVQKKVSELIGGRRFNNSFQIGMLSSFESFLESMARSRRTAAEMRAPAAERAEDEEGDDSEAATFDGHQTEDSVERRGIDSLTLKEVMDSYREHFGEPPPHPKLDATADELARCFDSGEKTLTFVRRIATTGELKAKLDRHYDRWLRDRLERELPEQLLPRFQEIFAQYERERPHRPGDAESVGPSDGGEEDAGGCDTFFAWFFRGGAPEGILSGAALQKNRLMSVSSSYGILFEEDHVAWLLGHPDDPIAELTACVGRTAESLRSALKRRAWAHFRERSQQRQGYPRVYVFEGYQVAALGLLAEAGGKLGERARVVLDERYEATGAEETAAPSGFPGPEQSIGARTFFTELAKRPSLRAELWPESAETDFARALREREMRRTLLSAMSRLGAAYIDLYIAAAGVIGSFELGRDQKLERPMEQIAEAFLDRLDGQRHVPGFHACRELAMASESLETLRSVNFPEAENARLADLPRLFARALQQQVPVGRMHGGVNHRMIRQFRMPGYPLVLVTTDVLQEGEDLHPFCRHVVHYGLSWTPSAMEQRTGRVDRISSLVQRRLDGRTHPPRDEELLQVYYPHLEDTVERLQVRRVMKRLNHFIHLVHRPRPREQTYESRVDVGREILREAGVPAAPKGALESAYPVQGPWLRGVLTRADVHVPDVTLLERRFAELWRWLCEQLGVRAVGRQTARSVTGRAALIEGKLVPWVEAPASARRRGFQLALRSQVAGDATLIRCASLIGDVAIDDPETLDSFYDAQRHRGLPRLCARPLERQRWRMSVEQDRLLHLETTQAEEVGEMVRTTIEQADWMEREILGSDQPMAEAAPVKIKDTNR